VNESAERQDRPWLGGDGSLTEPHLEVGWAVGLPTGGTSPPGWVPHRRRQWPEQQITQPTRDHAAHARRAHRNGHSAVVDAAPAPTAVITVAATATPRAEPACRVALYRALASPVRLGGTVSKPPAWIGKNEKACPIPKAIISATGTIGGSAWS